METAQEKAAETVEQVQEKAQEAVETVQEKVEQVAAPQDDGVLTVTVKEDKLLYEGSEVTLAQLEENLLKDYKAGEVKGLLQARSFFLKEKGPKRTLRKGRSFVASPLYFS